VLASFIGFNPAALISEFSPAAILQKQKITSVIINVCKELHLRSGIR
jgi:hypothetical protein